MDTSTYLYVDIRDSLQPGSILGVRVQGNSAAAQPYFSSQGINTQFFMHISGGSFCDLLVLYDYIYIYRNVHMIIYIYNLSHSYMIYFHFCFLCFFKIVLSSKL